jgi:GntR family transcriptional regulator
VECLLEDDARIVKAALGTPFSRSRRLAREEDGRVIEHVVSLLDSRHFAPRLMF